MSGFLAPRVLPLSSGSERISPTRTMARGMLIERLPDAIGLPLSNSLGALTCASTSFVRGTHIRTHLTQSVSVSRRVCGSFSGESSAASDYSSLPLTTRIHEMLFHSLARPGARS